MEDTSFNDRENTKSFSKTKQSFDKSSSSFASTLGKTKKDHNEKIIKTSGKYDIDQAMYEHEEYPDDFCSESGDEAAEADEKELTLIMSNY